MSSNQLSSNNTDQEFLYKSPGRTVYQTPFEEWSGLACIGYGYFRESFSLPWHHHERAFEICFVDEGEVTWEYENIKQSLFGNQFSVMPPRLIHRGVENSINPSRLYWIQFEEDLSKLGLSTNDQQRLLSLLTAAPLVRTAPINTKTTLKAMYTAMADRDNLAARGHFLVFLSELIVGLTHSPNADLHRNDIEKIVRFIDGNLHRNLSVKELASRINLNPSFFSEVFLEETGVLPKHFILNKRISAAKDRLKSGDETVTGIALDLGFSSGQHFSQTFRQYSGVSPGKWRKQVQGAGDDQ